MGINPSIQKKFSYFILLLAIICALGALAIKDPLAKTNLFGVVTMFTILFLVIRGTVIEDGPE